MAIIQAQARTPRRVRVVFASLPGGATTPTSYAFARIDGAYTSVAVASVWTTDTTTVELALSEALLDYALYTLTIGSDSAEISYFPPVQQSTVVEDLSDPEAETFGVDINWFSDLLDPSGDLPIHRGLQALRNDLVSVSRIIPGEIVHRPDVGAGLNLRVNGPNATAQLADMRGACKREWLKDDRVDDVAITATAGTDGTVTLNCNVKTVAIEESVNVVVNG